MNAKIRYLSPWMEEIEDNYACYALEGWRHSQVFKQDGKWWNSHRLDDMFFNTKEEAFRDVETALAKRGYVFLDGKEQYEKLKVLI